MKIRQPVLALKPTQFSIGILEVDAKFERLMKLNSTARQKFAFSKPVPVVISPIETLYILDHHHHIFSCWLSGVPFVNIKVVHDFSSEKMDFVKFWGHMEELSCVHLFDQFGEGPRNPLYLPPDIRGMADDPYRSLAWLVRKEGGYTASGENFAEFTWANFFRKARLLHETGRRGMQLILNDALLLAQSSDARKLPGYMRDARLISETKKRIALGKDAKTKFIFGKQSKGLGGTQPRR